MRRRRKVRNPASTQCIGKVRYPSFKSAKRRAATSTAKRPYKCDLCGGVHLTKTKRKGHL